jgi:hypothetical protein
MFPNFISRRRNLSVRILFAALAVAALPGPFATPTAAQAPSSQPAPAVTFRYADGPRDSGAAAKVLRVRVELAPGWHINSDAPLDEFLVPTTLDARAEGVKFGKPRFPPSERVRSDAFGGDVLLFSGAFEIEVPVLGMAAVAPKTAPTAPRTRVTLRYQACDHATCYPPKEATVER